MSLPVANEQDLRQWAVESSYYRREFCGLVYDGTAHQLLNEHPMPQRDFAVSPEAMQAFFEGKDVGLLEAVWHTHPNGDPNPSDNDLEWHPTQVQMWIVTQREVVAYQVNPDSYEVVWRHGFA